MNPEDGNLFGQEIETLQKIIDVVTEFVINYSFQIIGALITLDQGKIGEIW
jgi:small conductance mechanosensitive channel